MREETIMKKTIISALALMLGVLGFSGCTKTDDNISVEVNGGKTITFVAEMDSRTIMTGEKPNFSTNWVVGDKVGLYSFNTEYDNEDGSHSQTNYNRNRTFTVKSVSNGVATMTGTTYNSASSTGTHMFYGYYPCVENAKDEYTAVNMNIPSVQNMPVSETATFDPAANIMVAKPMSVNLNATNLTFNNIRFRHTVAFINLSTKAISAEGVSGDEIVSSVKFEAVGISENPTLAGDFQFNLEDGTMTFTKSESAVTVKVPDNTKLSDLSAWIVTNPFELTADDELVITITTDAHTIIKNVSIAKKFQAANVYTLNLTIDNKCEISVIVPEEPALDGTILWSENWTGYSKDTQPSDATNVYNNEVVTYTYGKAGTKVYEENLAKGTAPELLLARDGGLWNIHNIPTGNCKLATLSFKINKSSDTFCAISTDTNGVSISEVSITESYVHEYAITFSDGVKTFDLKFSNSSSSNSRLDDIELVVGKKIHKATPPTITVDSKDAGNGTFTASWTAIDGISQYAWRLTTDADKTTNVQSGKVNSTEITVAGLDVSTKYVLYVKSVGDGENYKDSDEAAVNISFGGKSEPILYEEFDNNTRADSSSAFSSTKFPNFSGKTSKAYTSKYGGVKLGSGSDIGYITSKSLDLSKPFTVKLDACKYGTDTGNIVVTVGSQSKTVNNTELGAAGTFKTFTLEFDAATATSTIKIATSAKRAYIDNVIVAYK